MNTPAPLATTKRKQKRFKTPSIDVWAFGTLAVALTVALPIFVVIGLALTPSGDIWAHLVETVLGHLVSTTLY